MLDDSDLMTSGGGGNGLPASCWYVAYTQPKREQVAADNLMRQGFEAYLPMYRTFKKSQREPLSGFGPMFPRYIFFKPGAGQSLSAARSTRGVAFILSFGCQPAVLNVEALEAIQDVERQLCLVDFHRPSLFRTGAKVKLARENLCGIEGLVTSVSTKRVNVLIEILGGHRRMSVEHHQLELA